MFVCLFQQGAKVATVCIFVFVNIFVYVLSHYVLSMHRFMLILEYIIIIIADSKFMFLGQLGGKLWPKTEIWQPCNIKYDNPVNRTAPNVLPSDFPCPKTQTRTQNHVYTMFITNVMEKYANLAALLYKKYVFMSIRWHVMGQKKQKKNAILAFFFF